MFRPVRRRPKSGHAATRTATTLLLALATALATLALTPAAAHAETVHLSGAVGLDLGPGRSAGVWIVEAYAQDGSVAGYDYQPRGDYAIDLPPGTYDFMIPIDSVGDPMVTTTFWVENVEVTSDTVHDFVFPTYQTTYHFVDGDGAPLAVDQSDNTCLRTRDFQAPDSENKATDTVTTRGQSAGSETVVWRAAVDDVAEPWVCSVRAYIGSDVFTASVPASTGADATVVLERSAPPGDGPDGVSDEVESHGANGGDGNGDGTQDSQQDNVTSLPANGATFVDGVPFLTVAGPAGTTLKNVSTIESSSLPTPPAGVTLPAGLASFVLSGLAQGATETVSIYPADMTGVNGYAKYAADVGWSVLPSDWVHVFDDHIDIDLTDGDVGDADGTADGVITDPGGVAKVVPSDSTPPTVTGAATTKPNAAGWYRTNVKVHWTATDPSGVAAQPTDTTATAEGANVTATSPQVCDKVAPIANCGVGTLTGLKIDKTAPSLAVTGVSNGATYTLGSGPVVGCSASDALSGLTGACKGVKAGGNSAGVGGFGYAAAVGDKAGNTRAAAATWNVVYGFAGFAAPLNDPAVAPGAPTSIFKAGSTVPVAFSLKRSNGTVATPASHPTWVSPVKGAKTSAPVNEAASTTAGTSGSSFVWRNNRWEYSWSTKGLASGYLYKIGVRLDDGSVHYLTVGLR